MHDGHGDDEALFRAVLNEISSDIVALVFWMGECVDWANAPRQALQTYSGTVEAVEP